MMDVPQDVLRAVRMGPIVRMQLHPVKTRKAVPTGWFTSVMIETEYFPYDRLEDPMQSDMPTMQKAVLLGLYAPPAMHDRGDWIQWTWRRTPSGDRLAARDPDTGGA